MLSTPVRGALAALAATVIWSGNFVIARGVADAIPPATLAFFRWAVACIALAPFAWKPLRREWPQLRRNAGYLALTALLGVTLFNTLIYLAGRSTETLNLSLISTCIPAFILLLSRIFLGEALTPARLGGLAAALAGVLLLITRGHPETLLALQPNPGDLWMLLAALLFAAYSILVRRKPESISPTALLGASFGLGLLFLLPWTALEVALGPSPKFSPPGAGRHCLHRPGGLPGRVLAMVPGFDGHRPIPGRHHLLFSAPVQWNRSGLAPGRAHHLGTSCLGRSDHRGHSAFQPLIHPCGSMWIRVAPH